MLHGGGRRCEGETPLRPRQLEKSISRLCNLCAQSLYTQNYGLSRDKYIILKEFNSLARCESWPQCHNAVNIDRKFTVRVINASARKHHSLRIYLPVLGLCLSLTDGGTERSSNGATAL